MGWLGVLGERIKPIAFAGISNEGTYRMQLFKDAGFKVMYIWGSDWKRVQANEITLEDALHDL